ncbi:MAG: hypothetical protein JSW02_01280 [candidate division WOR-3 bacterium]|nr:MAG: hypothetical protein JSW02_01280 [candidate division WOR-3 bacterium]
MRGTFRVLCVAGLLCYVHAAPEAGGMSLSALRTVMYIRLRNAEVDNTHAIQPEGYVLKNDIAEFTFLSGHVYRLGSAENRCFAMFFRGNAAFRLQTNDAIEKQQLVHFTGHDDGGMFVKEALFIFTDSTYDKLVSQHPLFAYQVDDKINENVRKLRDDLRHQFLDNTDARILADVEQGQYGEFFQAVFINNNDQKFIFTINPLLQEEVQLIHYKMERFADRASIDTWFSARAQDHRNRADRIFDMTRVELDIDLDERDYMAASARLHFVNEVEGTRSMSILLAPQLRVQEVMFNDSDTCEFLQEPEDLDAEVWIFFPRPLHGDTEYRLTLKYEGSDIVEEMGGGNYAVKQRVLWFPSVCAYRRDAARFVMKYTVPEKNVLLSSGKLVRRWNDGKSACSEWDSEHETVYAGFNYGRFTKHVEKGKTCEIECNTNINLADNLGELRRLLEQYKGLQAELMMLPHELTTDNMSKSAAIESQNAYEVYRHFFGPSAFTHVIISQQPYTSFAQSYPGLIYLPFTSFFRESVRERLYSFDLRFLRNEELFHEGLIVHEMAHQWWAHTVMTNSYRDAWINEGFATYCEALYAQTVEGIDKYKEYLEHERSLILRKTAGDIRLNDLGPICLGARLSSFEHPEGYRLIYSKGAFVLHMLRMMMFDYNKKSDERFIAMIKDFVRQYSSRVATTTEFKQVVENHFGRSMAWFFDQWVYGTGIPVYRVEHDISAVDGAYVLTMTVQQSNVAENFQMPLPVLVHFQNGYAAVFVQVTGSQPVIRQFRLPQEPQKIEINPWNAVLCEIAR